MTEIETLRGDVLSKDEMKRRGVKLIPGERGGFELRTTESLSTIAHWLVDMGFIEQHQRDTAFIYMDLHRAYEAAMGIKWMAIKQDLLEGLNLNPQQATELYDAIRHEIGVKHAGDVYATVSHAMMTPFVQSHIAVIEAYRRAFETLTKAMFEVRKKKLDVSF